MRWLRGLRARVVVLVVGVALLATSMALVALSGNTEQAIWDQAEADGALVGSIIAETIALSRELPDQFEKDQEVDQISTARLLAEYVALAERSRVPRAALLTVLEDLVKDLGVAEVWITDARGRVMYSVPRDVQFEFSPDPESQPQASAFWPLLTGEAKVVVQPILPRDLDGQPFKYVGVAGVDQARIVQIGVRQDDILMLRNRLSLERLSDTLMNQGVLARPLLVLDGQLRPVDALQSSPATGSPHQPITSLSLSPEQAQALQEALTMGQVVHRLEPEAAVIYRSYGTADGRHQGVFAAAFSRQGLDHLLQRQQRLLLYAGVAAVLAASVLGWLVSLRFTRRLGRITTVARGIRKGNFGRLDELQPDLQQGDELGVLAQVVHAMGHEVRNREAVLEAQVRQRTQELDERNQALAAAQAIIYEELDLAKRLQLGILPASFPLRAGWEGAARIRMQQQMGGDFFDFIERPDGSIALVMADVSGKGVAAAFFMAMARTTLQHHLATGLGPAKCLTLANEALCQANPLDLFVTVFVAVLDPMSGLMELANAGHNPPVLRRADGALAELSGPGDVALGVWSGYAYATAQSRLDAGELLLTYTDGVTEAFNSDGQAYGMDRLLQWMSSRPMDTSAQLLVDGLFDEILAFQGPAAQADDITVAVMRRELTESPYSVTR